MASGCAIARNRVCNHHWHANGRMFRHGVYAFEPVECCVCSDSKNQWLGLAGSTIRKRRK